MIYKRLRFSDRPEDDVDTAEDDDRICGSFVPGTCLPGSLN